MSWKIRVKEAMCSALFYSGALGLMEKRPGGSCVILAYHRVLPEDHEDIRFIQPGMYVTARTFEKHLEYVSRHFRLLKLEDLLTARDVDGSCIVTFDDGWQDNYRYAFPLLKKYGAPATIFLATGNIGKSGWPWPDRVSYFIRNGSHGDLAGLCAVLADHGVRAPGEPASWAKSPSAREAVVEQIISELKQRPHAGLAAIMCAVDSCMKELREDLDKKRPWLGWDEISEMSRHGISFGAHTHGHAILTRVPREEAEKEILLSIQSLKDHAPSLPALMFSYPNGDYNEEVVGILKRNGIDLAVSTEPGRADRARGHFSLNRFMIHEDMTRTIPMFACRIR